MAVKKLPNEARKFTSKEGREEMVGERTGKPVLRVSKEAAV